MLILISVIEIFICILVFLTVSVNEKTYTVRNERIFKMETIFNYIPVPVLYTALGAVTGLCLYLLFD